jgi:hypothetical protein
MFCDNVPATEIRGGGMINCQDHTGRSRPVGASWIARDGCNTCRCLESGATPCTKKFCQNTPAAALRDGDSATSCVDHNGRSRPVGTSWTARDGCNQCRCLKSGATPCTKKFCGNIPTSDGDQLRSLFNLNASVNTDSIGECNGDGKTNCKAVIINQDLIDNLTVGDTVSLLPGSNVTLRLTRSPTQGSSSQSYHFRIGQAGEGTVTVGNSGSVFGSLKPNIGVVDYGIENCGDNCNVLYERNSNFFNNFFD